MSKMLMALDDGWSPSWLAYGGKYHCKTLNENRTWVWQTEEGAKEEGGRRVPVFTSAGRLQGSRSGCGSEYCRLEFPVSPFAPRGPWRQAAGPCGDSAYTGCRLQHPGREGLGWGEGRGRVVVSGAAPDSLSQTLRASPGRTVVTVPFLRRW